MIKGYFFYVNSQLSDEINNNSAEIIYRLNFILIITICKNKKMHKYKQSLSLAISLLDDFL